MDAQQILIASALDIVFEGRNKDYGAYILRKEYNKRILYAMLITAGLIVVLLILYYSASVEKIVSIKKPVPTEYKISSFDNVVKKPSPRIAAPKKSVQPKMKTVKFTGPPLIVKAVTPEEQPPENAAMNDTKIGLIAQDGISDDGALPLQGTASGTSDGIEKQASINDSIFSILEIESSYPGGPRAWGKFLTRTLNYPMAAQDNAIKGTVVILFVVDANGTISNVEAISGPEELLGEAVRVIKQSGKWTPAIQNGRKVKSYKRQSIVFRFEE